MDGNQNMDAPARCRALPGSNFSFFSVLGGRASNIGRSWSCRCPTTTTFLPPHRMSTQIPVRTAKRQRLADKQAAAAGAQLDADGQLGPNTQSVVVQLRSAQDGSSLGPSLSLPAETSRKQLETIVNRLRRELKVAGADDEDGEDMPFAFHVALPSVEEGAQDRLPITGSVWSDVLQASAAKKLGLSTEDVLTVVFEPQAVFRVRPVTRNSSTLAGHRAPILCSTFSPTGTLLVTGSGDHTARIWDLENEQPVHALAGHRGWVLTAEWEGRERRLATGDKAGDVWVWDALNTAGGLTGKRAWSTRTGEQVVDEARARLQEQGQDVDTDSKLLSQAEKRAARRAAPQGRVLHGHTKWVTSLAWEPIHLESHNPRLASASKDGTVRVWDAGRGGCQYALGAHRGSVNCVRWGGDGLLYTASSDRTVKIWAAATGVLVRSLDAHAHWVNTLALSTDWTLRTGPYDHTGKTKAAIEGKTETELDSLMQAAAKERYDTAVAGRGESLISGSDDHTLFLWPAQAGGAETPKKPLARLTGHAKVVNHVAFSPDGRLAASASFDSNIKVWDAQTGKFIANLRAHVGSVYRLAWSPDSRLLVSASKDSTLKLWDMRSYKLKVDLPGHGDEVYCVDWVANKVASGGADRVLKIWSN